MGEKFLAAAKVGTALLKAFSGMTAVRDGHRVVTYESAYKVFSAMCKVKGYRISAEGGERINPGAGWVVSKHISGKDIPDLSSMLYKATGRMPYFVARSTLVEDGWHKAQYEELGAKFIDRENTTSAQMRDIVETVGRGNLMVIFPEGTRIKGRVGEFHPGFAALACMLLERYEINAPIYCAGIERMAGIGAKIRVAPPVYAAGFGGYSGTKAERREKMHSMAAALREKVARLSGLGAAGEKAGSSIDEIISQSWLALSVFSDPSARCFFGI